MKLSEEMKIEEIQAQFAEKFPHLKIEFYGHSHLSGEGSALKDQLDPSTILRNISAKNYGEVDVNGNMTVSEFESSMEINHGIHIQVFRKSGELWLQTSSTDHWTLDVQEGKGSRSEQYI